MKLLLLLLLLPKNSWAHGGGGSWNWDPLLLFSLAFLSFTYLLGSRRISNLSPFKLLCFLLSLLITFIALVSPLDHWSDELQAWHMIQHMLLMAVAAPLMSLSSPMKVISSALPRNQRKQAAPLLRWGMGKGSGWYLLWQPISMWSIFAFTLWIWHLPKFYQAALKNERLHDFQHISFFVTSVLFWRFLLDPIGRLRPQRFVALFYVFATILHATLLGVFMGLSPKIWYPFYQNKTASWGLSPLEDQQLAGLIMWMPACMIYVVITSLVFIKWMKESGKDGTSLAYFSKE